MKRSISFLSLLVFSLLMATVSHAQVSITTLGPPGAYTQNFDGLGTGNFSLTDNTSITGVYARRQSGNAVPNVFSADTGTSNTGQLKNYGSAGAADRTLGSLSSNTPDTLNYGIRFVNNTGIAIASLQITYTGEQWRTDNNTPQVLSFDYRQAATVTDLTTGTYTAVPALNFTTPVNTSSGAALDGNLPANRTVITAGFLVSIPVGQEIMIRWTDINDTGNDQGVGIDDLSVIFRAAPTAADASITGRAVNASGRGIGKVWVRLIGGTLAEPLYALTNAFGYYRFENVPSGQTYIISAESRRYRFTNPVQAVNLADNLTELNFTAEPSMP